MSALDALAPDQRAVVQLVLQQRRSYTDLANLLGISVEAVRTRAHAGLAALTPLPAPDDEAALADYLLGQGKEPEMSAPARAWAADVAAALATVPGAQLPELPAEEGEEAPPAREGSEGVPLEALAAQSSARPPRRSTASSSRVGGALLIGVVVVLVIFGAISLLRDDEDDPAAETGATATATSTAAPPTVVGTIDLAATRGHEGKGVMTLFTQDGQLAFTIEGAELQANGDDDAYAVWLTGGEGDPVNLGFASPVGDDGQLGLSGPQEKDLERFPTWLANHRSVVVSKETAQDAKQPEEAVLRGRIPRGSGSG